eukprot:Amastigsp_a510941_5.p3 type:complete len:174 gc:universal Amastigsp_a510941_5:968-447(-)
MSRVHDSKLGGRARGTNFEGMSSSTSPCLPVGCPLSVPSTCVRVATPRVPEMAVARFSSSGSPSEVSSPLKILTATASPLGVSQRTISPDAPSPSVATWRRPLQSNDASGGAAGLGSTSGLPEIASQASAGSLNSHGGSDRRRLQDKRTSSRPVQAAIESGSVASSLPASMSF